MKRRITQMIVEVSYDPETLSAAGARREVRTLIKEGTGYHFEPGDTDGVRVRSVRPRGRQ